MQKLSEGLPLSILHCLKSAFEKVAYLVTQSVNNHCKSAF